MHRVVAIALAGNRIEITEMVVNPLADDADRHTCGKNCVVFRSPNLLPRVRILRGIVVTDNRGDASLLQGCNFAGTVICGIKNRIFHSTTPCNPVARAPRKVKRAEPLRYTMPSRPSLQAWHTASTHARASRYRYCCNSLDRVRLEADFLLGSAC